MRNESKAMYMMSSYHRIARNNNFVGKKERKGENKVSKYYYICPKLIYFVNKN